MVSFRYKSLLIWLELTLIPYNKEFINTICLFYKVFKSTGLRLKKFKAKSVQIKFVLIYSTEHIKAQL